MPMVSRVATAATATAGAMAFQRFITTANNLRPGSNLQNEAGLYGCYWSIVATANAAGSACPPIFTWYDASISAGMTASGNVQGLFGFTTAFGASALSGVSGMSVSGASGYMAGTQYMQCGSGASGVSAYLQWAVTGNSGSTQGFRFDAQLFKVDDWGV